MTSIHPDPSTAAHALRARLREFPDVLVVLGSGLPITSAEVQEPVEVPFEDVPGFPPAGVLGHPGRYLAGRMGGRAVLFQRGRFHHYEGHSPAVVAAPIRTAAALGIRFLILTNVTGGIRRDLVPGTLVLVNDHVNFQFRNPLVGRPEPGEERFPDMGLPWDRELTRLAAGVAREEGIAVSHGCYGAVLGPNFETPAEIRALRHLGADVVGMSTVPELLVARALGMRVVGISLVVNPAAGLGGEAIDHESVLEVSRIGGGEVIRLVRGLVERLPRA